MIFGFNTDVKVGDTVYHVQSEARKADQLLQTQVFVRGRCIGKKATSYAEKISSPDFNDDRMHEMLKAQHKTILEAVRESRVEAMLEKSDSVRIPATPTVSAAACTTYPTSSIARCRTKRSRGWHSGWVSESPRRLQRRGPQR